MNTSPENHIGDALPAPACVGADTRTWRGWSRGELQIHFIYTGVCESIFWIFPDGTTMLLDCGDLDVIERGTKTVPVLPNPCRHAGEWVARYVTRVNPSADRTQVDYMMLSHFHSDHSGQEVWYARKTVRDGEDYCLSGFSEAAETLRFRKAFDRGWPAYDDPCTMDDYDTERTLPLMRKLYRHLSARDGLVVEKFVEGRRDQVKALHGGTEGFSIFNLCANGRIADEKTGAVVDLYKDYPDRQPGFQGKKWINENGMSLGMIVRYGAFSFYTAGDFSDKAALPEGFERFEIEDRLAEVVPRVTVAKVNHHGHYSMPEKLVKALAPRAWLSGVWDQAHNVPPVMERLADRSIYPGERTIAPCLFPRERLEAARAANAAWLRDVDPASFGGAHVVLGVPPGGESFSLAFLSAADESMRVLAVREYASGMESDGPPLT